MGCASSAALPFLTGRGTQAVNESANGKPSFELNNKSNGTEDIAETSVTDRMKDAVDSSVARDVMDGAINTKDEIVHQIEGMVLTQLPIEPHRQGAGEAITNKMSSVVEGVEEAVESTIDQATSKIGEAEDKIKSEVEGIGEKISSFVGSAGAEAEEKTDEIDELLAALPDEDEIAAQSKATAEELIEAATEEVKEDEMNN